MKLPTGFKSTMWQIEVETYVDIHNIQIGSSAKALAKA